MSGRRLSAPGAAGIVVAALSAALAATAGPTGLRPAAAATAAAPADAASAPAAEVLLLDVVLNGAPRHLVCRFTRGPGGALGAQGSELRDAGLDVPAGSAAVLLSSLPGVTYRIDTATQTILIAAPLDRLVRQDIDLGPMRGSLAPEPVVQSYGLVANYDLYGAGATHVRRPSLVYQGASASLEMRALTPYGTVRQTAILGTTTGRSDVTALRLDTTFTHVDLEAQRITRFGDVITGGLAWSRPVRLGGLQVERDFGLRPDLVTLPLPNLSGTAAVPSSLSVFVNGVQTYSQAVSAGPYQLNNIPAVTGAGSARVVLRDASGQEVQQTLPFFVSARLLRPGLYDYSIEAGFARLNYATENFDYARRPGFSGSGRYGLTDWLTLEGHVEASPRLGLGGLGFNVRTGTFGVLSGAAAASASADGDGLLAYGSYQTQAFGLSLQFDSQRTVGRYRDLAAITARPQSNAGWSTVLTAVGGTGLFSSTSALTPLAVDRVSVGMPLNRWASSINASLTNYVTADLQRSRIASLSYSLQVPWNGALFASAFADLASRRNAGVVAGLSFPIGRDISTSAQASTGNGQRRVSLQASKALGEGIGGLGWNVVESEGDGAVRSGALDYRSRYGQIGAAATQVGDQVVGTGHFSGGVVAMPGAGVHVGPRIDDSFAIVKAGAPDVAVMLENKQVGLTDRNGELLLGGLHSSIANKISIDATSLPANTTIGRTAATIAPQNGGGTVVDFGVDPAARSVQVHFIDKVGADIPPGSTGHSGASDFVVGYDGLAFLTGLGARADVSIDLAAGPCAATFDVDPTRVLQTIGPVPCQ